MRYALWPAGALALVAHAAAAQAPANPQPPVRRDTIPLSAIVVTAPRISVPLADNPAAMKIVDSDVLDAAPRGIAVDEAVLLVPGVKVDNKANGKRVHMSIRGQGILSEHGIRGTKVLLDGLPLNDPSGFAADLYDVDWPTVEWAQVQRGPEASLYGGGSSAGVLSIQTADGGSAPAGGMLSSTVGSNGFWRGTGQVGGSLGDLNYRMSYSHLTGDGYRVHTAFHGDNVYAKAHWTPSAAVHLTPVLWYTAYFNQNAEGLNLAQLNTDPRMPNPDALTYNEFMDTRRVMGGVVGEIGLGGDRTLSFNAYLRHTDYKEAVPSDVLHRTMLSPGGTLQYTFSGLTGALRHHVSFGSDVELQTIADYTHGNLGGAVEGGTLLSDQTMRQAGAGVFVLDRIDLGERWGAMVNVRFDWLDNRLDDHLQAGGVDLSGDASFQRGTARVGVTYSPTPSLNFYGNVGQGFLPPATEELDANPVHIGGFNDSLKAATSTGEEVGARGVLARGLSFDLTLFHMNTEGDFDRYRVASRPLETFYRNAGSTRRYGVEASAAWAPGAEALVQVAYTYSDFKYTNTQSAYGDVQGHWLPNSPAHQLAADARYTFAGAFTVGVSTEMLSKWYVDAGNATSQAGYALLNARLAYRLHLEGTAAEVTFAVRNIFGTQYVAFTEPDPDGNSYQPAATREIFVGIVLGK
jgi:iron complex outermembrane receptor protein